MPLRTIRNALTVWRAEAGAAMLRAVPPVPVLPRFLLLYAALFAGFGVASPFLPGLLLEHGLSGGQLSAVLAAGTAVRILAGPVGGRLADWSGRAPLVLAALLLAAAAVATCYGPARGVSALLLVVVCHAAVLAPATPVADALALGSAAEERFAYGTVRGAGSAAFIAGVMGSGLVVGAWGLDAVVWQNAALLLAAAACALLLPNRVAGSSASGLGGVGALLRLPAYLRLMVVAALIGGSHAVHDAFAVVRWRAAGLSAGQCGALWSLSVAGEVAMFLLLGPRLLRWLGPGRAAAVAALAGVLRWGVEAETAAWPVLAMAEPLHGFTFALLHLACMAAIGRAVPAPLAATAQAFYGTVATGGATVLATLAAGPLFEAFGARAFWAMALLCAAALPVARGIATQEEALR